MWNFLGIIEANAGNPLFQPVMDPGLRRGDDLEDRGFP
jgi:hypothetical protein